MKGIFRRFIGNKKREQIMIHCSNLVKKDAVRRETIDGVEHIIVSSVTLPDNIVMNGGLYPAEEIEKSYQTLENTFAPVEHPTDADGNYIPAATPEAIHNFHAGAFNKNVRRENGRVLIDKYINVNEALKSERGKRLLERIEEIETNADARPIHTSTGVFLAVEMLDKPMKNNSGQEYTWVASEMVFDHDAILLDSIGAAQPHQGVGVAVNKSNEFKVFQHNLSKTNEEQSFDDLRMSLRSALESSAYDCDWMEEVFPSSVIFSNEESLFQVSYQIDGNGLVTLVGAPVQVERKVIYSPIVNNSEKGDAMKAQILAMLANAGIDTKGMDDDALLAALTKLQANQSEGDDSGKDDDITSVVANAVKAAVEPLASQVESLKSELQTNQDAELGKMADIVANSELYPGLDKEAAMKLGIDTIKAMAANCQPAFGIAPTMLGNQDEKSDYQTEMPE